MTKSNPDSAAPMEMPSSRTQVRLFLSTMMALILVALAGPILSRYGISSVKEGDIIVYRYSFFFILFAVSIVAAAGVPAVIFRTQRTSLSRTASIGFFILAAFLVFLLFPLAIMNNLVLAPDHLSLRTGYWFLPEKVRIDFDSVSNIKVVEREKSQRKGWRYELYCFKKTDGTITRVPVDILVKNALPGIFDRASRHNIVIDRQQMPDKW